MGGASAQIAFEPAKMAAELHRHDLAEVTLRSLDGSDIVYRVFVATFLGHGTNEARRRYVDLLASRAVTAAGITNDDSGLQQLPVADDPCLATGLTLPTTDGRAVLRGTGQFSACVAASEPLLNNTACPIEPCLFAGVHAPEIDFGTQRFVGVSEYWYASHDYLGLGGMWDVEKFEAQATRFCQLPWTEVMQHNPHDTLDSVVIARLQMQCFKAAWLVNVLHKGFGVPRRMTTPGLADMAATPPAPFQSVNQVGDVEVSWTLGALLLKISRTIPPSYHTIKAKTRPGIRLPDNPTIANEDVELADDSLWSPLQFVGLRRLLVLWSLQTPVVRTLLALAALGTCALLSGLLCWLSNSTRRRQTTKPAASPAFIPLMPFANNSRHSPRIPLSPSQLGIAEAQYSSYSGHDMAGDSHGHNISDNDASNRSTSALRRSPSMFVLDLFASRQSKSPGYDYKRAADSVPSSPREGALTPTDHNLQYHRSVGAALAVESSPISRSSSVSNLMLASRRRGGANGDVKN